MGPAQAGMGVAWGDVDGDGLMDIFVTHLAHRNAHTLEAGAARLVPGSDQRRGPVEAAVEGTGFGAVLADFDLDGHLDLALVNGHVAPDHESQPASGAVGPALEQVRRSQPVFANDGRGGFVNVTRQNPAFCSRFNVGRCLA